MYHCQSWIKTILNVKVLTLLLCRWLYIKLIYLFSIQQHCSGKQMKWMCWLNDHETCTVLSYVGWFCILKCYKEVINLYVMHFSIDQVQILFLFSKCVQIGMSLFKVNLNENRGMYYS